MTTVDALNRHLDQNPSDQGARLALADALREADSPLADGTQALALLGVWPYRRHKYGDYGFVMGMGPGLFDKHHLPSDWFRLLEPLGWMWEWRRTRRAMEEDAAAVFPRLPPERQAELLSAVVGGVS